VSGFPGPSKSAATHEIDSRRARFSLNALYLSIFHPQAQSASSFPIRMLMTISCLRRLMVVRFPGKN